jgi:hypothetical protein
MTKITKDVMVGLQQQYESGEFTLSELSKTFGASPSAINNLAKRHKWNNPNTKVRVIRVADNPHTVPQLLEVFQDKSVLLTSTSVETQLKILGLVTKAVAIVERFFAENPSGRYVKSYNEMNGVTIYGLVTDALSPLTPLLAKANPINIQNNFIPEQQTQESNPVININGVSVE